MPLGADETQAIVEQLLPLLSQPQGTPLSDLIAAVAPQVGALGAVAYAAVRRIRALEVAIFETQTTLNALSDEHNSDTSKFANAPTVTLLEDLVEANAHQHTFNTWVGNAVEFLIEQSGAVIGALVKHGVDITFNEAKAGLLKMNRPAGGK